MQEQQQSGGRVLSEPLIAFGPATDEGWQAPGTELSRALLKAQRIVKAALKTGKNDHHGYRYVPAEEILLVAREAIDEAGITVIPLASDWIDGHGEIVGGAAGHLRARFCVIHADTAQAQICSMDVAVCPTRSSRDGWSRPLDKAEFAAMTETLGYFFRGLLLIPRKDAQDVSSRRDGGTRPRYGRGEETPQEQTNAQPRAEQPAARGPAARPPLSIDGWILQISRADAIDALAGLYSAARSALARHPEELRIDEAAADVLIRRLEAAPREALEELRLRGGFALRGPALDRLRQALQAARRSVEGSAS